MGLGVAAFGRIDAGNGGSLEEYPTYGNFAYPYAPYDAFGNTTSTTFDRYGYTGREWDSALQLQYSRARMYDPASGRFLSQDPLSFAAGDSNLYRYVGNNPTGATDPSGLWTYDNVLLEVAARNPSVAMWMQARHAGTGKNFYLGQGQIDWWGREYVRTRMSGSQVQFHIPSSWSDAEVAEKIIEKTMSTTWNPSISNDYWDFMRNLDVSASTELHRIKQSYQITSSAQAGLLGANIIKGIYTIPAGVGAADVLIELSESEGNAFDLTRVAGILRGLRQTQGLAETGRGVVVKVNGQYKKFTHDEIATAPAVVARSS